MIQFNVKHSSNSKNRKAKRSLLFAHLSTSNTNTLTLFNRFTNILRKQILVQMKFIPANRGRFAARNILTKYYGDEVISVFFPTFQLITCRRCNTLAKAHVSSRLTCLQCSYVKTSTYNNGYTKWDMWSHEI